MSRTTSLRVPAVPGTRQPGTARLRTNSPSGRPVGRGGAPPIVAIGLLGVFAWMFTAGPLHGGDNTANTSDNAPVAVSGTVTQWISQADTVLAANGIQMSPAADNDVKIIIHYESGGNPASVNNTDINARQGNPSKGLMQTTGTTFASNCAPGYCANIDDPVSNIVAGVLYAIRKYGSLDNTPGPRSINAGGRYKPY